MGEREEEITGGVGNALQDPQDSNIARLAPSVEQLAQMDGVNTTSADAIMIGGEHSESAVSGMSRCPQI